MSVDDLRPGLTVCLEDSDGYRCRGEVKSVDRAKRTFKLKNCRSLDSGKKEPGDQLFAEKALVSLDIDSGGGGDNPQQSSFSTSELKMSLPPSDKSREDPTPCGDSHRAVRHKMVSENRRRADNPHLSNLHSVDMTDLLDQGQMDPVPKMVELHLQPGKPKKVPRPKLTAVHQEGNLFKGRMNPGTRFTNV
jgi:hypothetical protein